MVDPCEKGKYRRAKGVVHSDKIRNEIINEKLSLDNLEDYLQGIEIVNVPNWSTHSMLCDTKHKVWIVEPGRGAIHSLLKPNDFKVMTNFSLIEAIQNKETISCERYITANKLLSDTGDMGVRRAFEILQAVKQSEGEWITAFSMVYDHANKTVYYVIDQDFTTIKEFVFQ